MLTIPDDLRELSRLTLEDQAIFVPAVTESGQKSWLYFFPFLYSFSLSTSQTLLWERHGAAICLYVLRLRDDRLRLEVYLPPFPFDGDALRWALERANSFNRSRSSRVIWMDQHHSALLEREGLEVKAIEEEFVYDGEQVRSARGKDFERLRRKLNQTRRIPGLQIRPYRAEDHAACKDLLVRWRRLLRDEKRVEIDGYWYTMRCLEHAADFQAGLLKGEVITVDDRICAFTFGGRISASYASIFITISDHDVPGLGYLQRHSLMTNNPEMPYFNDSSDAGRAGLSEVKRAFNPVEMHTLYRGYQREAAP